MLEGSTSQTSSQALVRHHPTARHWESSTLTTPGLSLQPVMRRFSILSRLNPFCSCVVPINLNFIQVFLICRFFFFFALAEDILGYWKDSRAFFFFLMCSIFSIYIPKRKLFNCKITNHNEKSGIFLDMIQRKDKKSSCNEGIPAG